MLNMRLSTLSRTIPYYANSLDAVVPEKWAQTALMLLEAETVMVPLVHRDFSDLIAEEGDVVNAHSIASMVAKRKDMNDDVTIQDATATNVPVKLDQHPHATFLLRDREIALGFGNLVQQFLRPAVQGIARHYDEMLLAQKYRFLHNSVGALGVADDEDDIIALEERMNTNLVPQGNRHVIITPNQKAALLGVDLFVHADKRGDGGAALKNAEVGHLSGFDFYMSNNNTRIVDPGYTTRANVVNGAHAAGNTAILVAAAGGVPVAGEWCTIAGRPYRIQAYNAGTLTMTIESPGLLAAIPDLTAVTTYTGATVNLAAGYALGYGKDIIYDGLATGSFLHGQLVSFLGTAGTVPKHGILTNNVSYGSNLNLDRPTEQVLANNDIIGVGPPGNYGFAFVREAIALVSRPLPSTGAALGASMAVANAGGLSVRVTISYDATKQGVMVTVDSLCGVAVLDSNLGAVLLG